MDQTQSTTTADPISLLDDFHAVLKACGRLSEDALTIIEEELHLHKTNTAAATTGTDAGTADASTGTAATDASTGTSTDAAVSTAAPAADPSAAATAA